VRPRSRQATAAAAALLAALVASVPGAAEEDEALRELERRLLAYVELRRQQAETLPPLDPRETDAAKISQHALSLAAAVRSARSDARPGDIFHEGVRPRLLALVRDQLRRDAAQQSAIAQGNPGPLFLFVNAGYPEGGSWSTVPPELLRRLPPLPDDLQYRFAARHLLLVDTRARILVDFLPKAAPR